jgi:amphi-Trp domain-containing protein
MENVVSDVKVEQKRLLSRKEAARFLAELAEGLGDDGKVNVQLGSSTLALSVADQLRWELEVAVDGDEIELELELKWSTSARSSTEPMEEASGAVEEETAAELDTDTDELETDADETEADETEAGQIEEGESVPEVSAEVGTDEGESEQAAGTGEVESEQPPAPGRSANRAAGRRRATNKAGKPAFNGVDTAAVRAWAGANGLTVSPRGRIKDEVLAAYRAAGN